MPLDMALGGWRRLLSVGPEVVGAPVKTQYMVFLGKSSASGTYRLCCVVCPMQNQACS